MKRANVPGQRPTPPPRRPVGSTTTPPAIPLRRPAGGPPSTSSTPPQQTTPPQSVLPSSAPKTPSHTTPSTQPSATPAVQSRPLPTPPAKTPEIAGPPPSYSNLAIKPNIQAQQAIGYVSPAASSTQTSPTGGEKTASQMFAGQMVQSPLLQKPIAASSTTQSGPAYGGSVRHPRGDRFQGVDPEALQKQFAQEANEQGRVGAMPQVFVPQQGVRPQQQHVETLVGKVASGELKTPTEVYNAYNKSDNPLTWKSEEQYIKDIRVLGEKYKSEGGNVSDFKTEDGKIVSYSEFDSSKYPITSTKERIYLNPKADHAPEVMEHVVGSYLGQNNPGVTGAKIWSPEDIKGRNDGILIYTNGPEATQQVVQGLQKYQQDGNLHKFHAEVPMMTNPQAGTAGISLGADPDTNKMDTSRWAEGFKGTEDADDILWQTPTGKALHYGLKPSFGQLRSDSIWMASQHADVKTPSGAIDPQKLSAETRRTFEAFGVDPDDVSKNLP